ncbi:MAG: alkaline phosphatase [Pseudomonadota bacterium]|jgi:alkaline phosphatase D
MIRSPGPRPQLSRRQLLHRFGGAAAVAFSLPAVTWTALAAPIFLDWPFQLGIASGEPTHDGVVLWTRLAPRPFEPGSGMPMAPVEVGWEIAEDERFRTIAQSGTAVARPELGHAVHVEVAGLQPNRPYWYRFTAGAERSNPGRTRTLPPPGAPVDKVRFAVAGCQNFEQGYYDAFRHLSREGVDFVYHYGDYIYEYRTRHSMRDWHSNEIGAVPRKHHGDEIYSLDDYRRRYAQYKMDVDLQAAHAAAPWFMVWDDHEIDNNWAAAQDEDGTPPDVFGLRRAVAAQAYYENMPFRRRAFPQGPAMRIHQQTGIGDLIAFNLCDTRQFRSDQPCNDGFKAPCGDIDLADATLLGAAQEAWLFDNLAKSRQRWNVIAQQVIMMSIDYGSADSARRNLDAWDGYRAARRRLVDHIQQAKVKNTIVLTGDTHQHHVGMVTRTDDDPDSGGVAVEFGATSISSNGDGGEARREYPTILSRNGHLKLLNDQRGYQVHEVTPTTWTTHCRVMDRVEVPGGTLSTRASFVVEAGKSEVAPA